ncbi:MAG: hypothetical protein M1537_02020 [Nitrospirae bacterium]|nr:hypothetical protein [Nitrospirota bacterium]MCL5284246.1 hypothetical protein [Nitrospirota bacterium]
MDESLGEPVNRKIIDDVISRVQEEIGKHIDPSLRLEIEDYFLVNDVMGPDGQIQRNPIESMKRTIFEALEEALREKPAK